MINATDRRKGCKVKIMIEKVNCYHVVDLLSSMKVMARSEVMGNMSIRNLPEETHAALKLRAKSNKRSAEAEVRALLVETFVAETEGGFGTRLRSCFKYVQGEELDVERDKSAARPVVLRRSF